MQPHGGLQTKATYHQIINICIVKSVCVRERERKEKIQFTKNLYTYIHSLKVCKKHESKLQLAIYRKIDRNRNRI